MLFRARINLYHRSKVLGAILTLAALGFGGCAQQPQQLAAASHGKEYFPSSKYGAASRRVVADGQPIPRGGGQYLVGKPYTVAGQTYYPSEHKIVQVGNASWYGDAFHGRLTANGEIYDKNSFTAAHPTMPLPSYARITNLRNNSSMIVRVNDRGPYASNRIMDVSGRVADALDFKRYGTAKLKVEYVGRASLAGSDDAHLLATLRTDGPAQWRGEPTMVAAAAPPARVASLAPYAPVETRAEVETTMEPAPDAPRRARRDVDRDAATNSAAPDTMATDTMAPDTMAPDMATRHAFARTAEDRSAPVHRQARSSHDLFRDHDDVHHAEAERRERQLPRDQPARLVPEPPVRAVATRLQPAMVKYSLARTTVNTATVSRSMSGKPARSAALPPSRPMDLGTIPGADSPIRAHHAPGPPSRGVPLRLARSRDD